jgi:hypothetical protein
VIATGRLRQRSYEITEGEKRTVHESRSMSPAYRSATPQRRSPGPAVPATVSPRTPPRPPAVTATSRRSDVGLSWRISKPPISSTPWCDPAPASARNPLTMKRHSIWRTSSCRAISSRLDPRTGSLVRPTRRNARARRRRPGLGCSVSLGAAIPVCIGDSGSRPAAGCAPEHLGESAFRQRVAGLHA